MQRLVLRDTTRPARHATRPLTVCVVDPQTDDYEGWQATAEAHGLRFQIVAAAEEALRLARTSTVDLWVINTELPGLTGYELCSMLKARQPAVPVYLVAEECTSDSERAAWAARATLFSHKPAHRKWLDLWIEQKRSRQSFGRIQVGPRTTRAAAQPSTN